MTISYLSLALPAPPCTDAPELFFAEQMDTLRKAQAICATCPLAEACLAQALQRREPWGVWGGQVLQGGQIIARKRGRGRPRKKSA